MSKKSINWLDNFAETYKQSSLKKVASKTKAIIVEPSMIKNSKVGDYVKYAGKLCKVADLDFADEHGPGVVLHEVTTEVPTCDPMSMSMGTEVSGLENKCVVEPERARTNPGDIYDLDCRDQEASEALMAADETAVKIEQENSIDRTNVSGHYENPVNAHDFSEQTSFEELETEELVEELETEELVGELEIEGLSSDESYEDDTLVAKRNNRIMKRIIAKRFK